MKPRNTLKNNSKRKNSKMSYIPLSLPADTLKNNIIAGLYAMKLIPEGMNVLDINFSDLNTKSGMVDIKINSQKEKEVQVTVTRPK